MPGFFALAGGVFSFGELTLVISSQPKSFDGIQVSVRNVEVDEILGMEALESQ